MSVGIFRPLCAATFLAFAAQANASTILVTEDFTYPDGSLTANPAWSDHSGTTGDLLVDNGAAVVQHGVPSEDANIAFADTSSGLLVATFDIVVEDEDEEIESGDNEYFAHFFTDGSFNFRARVDVVPATGGGDYSLGISSTSSSTEATLGVDFDFGDTVPVELSFDLDTGIGFLTAGGVTIAGTSSSTGETLNRFALRQSDSASNEAVIVDNLVISLVPEPGSVLLIVLGAAFAGMVRMRRVLG